MSKFVCYLVETMRKERDEAFFFADVLNHLNKQIEFIVENKTDWFNDFFFTFFRLEKRKQRKRQTRRKSNEMIDFRCA